MSDTKRKSAKKFAVMLKFVTFEGIRAGSSRR